MLTRVLDFVVGREPVATATGIAAVVTAALGLGAVFGLAVTAEQIAAIGALAAALAGWAGRRAVSPVTSPGERKANRLLGHQPNEPFDTVADDTRIPDDGGIPLAMIILIVVVFLILGGAFATCDALWDDAEEPGDLGLAAELVVVTPSGGMAGPGANTGPSPRDHEYDDGCWDGECGRGGDENRSGYYDDGGGSSGGRYEGGRGGDDYDGDGDGNRCRNFCVYPVEPPPSGGEGGRP